MKEPHKGLINQLIEIGHSEAIPPNAETNVHLRESLEQKSPSIKINDCGNFSTEDLKSLYKGLVLSEKEFRWLDGSNTKTARILQVLNERLDLESDYQEVKELYEFGFANRGHNDYVPTGTRIHHACVTYEDYLEVNYQKANNIAKHNTLMLKQQEESKRMKATKKEFKERAKEKNEEERAERKKNRDKNISIIDKQK